MSRSNHPSHSATARLNTGDAARDEQVRAHRVSLLSLHPSPAPSTRSPSPDTAQRSRNHQQRSQNAAADADAAALEPPTLASYHSALRYHILALLPTFALILVLSWVSSTYADLSRHHHPSRKPPLILIPLGAAAWLAAYALRPLVWDFTDQLLRLLSVPFALLARVWAHRRNRTKWARSTQPSSPNSHGTIAEWEEEQAGVPQPYSPVRTISTLTLSILLRTLILELLRVGSMALSIAVLDASTRKDHIWIQSKATSWFPPTNGGDLQSRSLRLSPYDNRFGAVLWTTVGWCSAEWLIGSYDVIRKLRLYHPSLWPSAIYSEPSAYQDNFSDRSEDDDEDDRHDEADHDVDNGNHDHENDTFDQEAAFPRTRTRASQPHPAGSSGIEAATTAAQAAVHAVRFFPRVFTQASAKSSSSSAFTVRPSASGNGGAANGSGSAFALPSTQPSGAQARRRAANQRREYLDPHDASVDRRQDGSEAQSLLSIAPNPMPTTGHHEHFSTALHSTYSGAYGTFQTARTHHTTAFPSRIRGEQADPSGARPPFLGPIDDDDDDDYGDDDHDNSTIRDEPMLDLDPEEEAALQSRLAHALAILLAARERADLEETLGARLDVQVRPALAALWRIDGFVWNLGECLLMAAAVAITSDGWSSSRKEQGGNEYYETVPDLTASPLLPTWLVLTALHTILSMLWATALPKLGFAPVSYASLLLGMGLTVAGLAWWGVLV
ncbi:unnamed protein product [Tilletia controversa]|uniref:Uncharacterized protein n=3 Tax=Tilletia TaxID=13289 RepID=A0A8X7SZA0_9BASI|nr:hypothetical protein CF328_g7090 [Tilletia controversa]KAE8188360.1 hypothetical protein CF335_g6918 [Tilletia laevis]KAE8248349.1 hypothetical protein A4X03_0g6804 [Tilletia caries]KAE8197046.1 hypothetical protein CF336_g2340 [Tilletia laevis]KAE8253392.1 hypothetical protein A4X06_0g1495 [Tilletia controversa]